MKVFVLEDDPMRVRILRELLMSDDVTFVESCVQADQFQPPYDLILLDHDLGGRQMDEHEDCGLTFVRLIKDRLSPEDIVIVHSFNFDGAQAMHQEIRDTVAFVSHCPFGGNDFRAVIKQFQQELNDPHE